MGHTINVSNNNAPVYINTRRFSYKDVFLVVGATAVVLVGGYYFLGPIIAKFGGTVVLCAAAVKIGITRQASEHA